MPARCSASAQAFNVAPVVTTSSIRITDREVSPAALRGSATNACATLCKRCSGVNRVWDWVNRVRLSTSVARVQLQCGANHAAMRSLWLNPRSRSRLTESGTGIKVIRSAPAAAHESANVAIRDAMPRAMECQPEYLRAWIIVDAVGSPAHARDRVQRISCGNCRHQWQLAPSRRGCPQRSHTAPVMRSTRDQQDRQAQSVVSLSASHTTQHEGNRRSSTSARHSAAHPDSPRIRVWRPLIELRFASRPDREADCTIAQRPTLPAESACPARQWPGALWRALRG